MTVVCGFGSLHGFIVHKSDNFIDCVFKKEIIVITIYYNWWNTEAELLNRDECIRTGKKECACKRQDLRYGDDPGACEKVNDSYRLNKIRKPGYELKNSGI